MAFEHGEEVFEIDAESEEDAQSTTTQSQSIRQRLRHDAADKAKAKAPAKAQQQITTPVGTTKGKSKGKDKSKGSEGQKKKVIKGALKGGLGKKYCKGCGLYYDAHVFMVNDPYCPRDRPAVRHMQRAAKAQGKESLFLEIKKNPERLQALVAKYHEEMGVTEEQQHLAPWSWAAYEEFETASKQVRRRVRGVMMHEES